MFTVNVVSVLSAARSRYVVEMICLFVSSFFWLSYNAASSSKRTWSRDRNLLFANGAASEKPKR